MFRHSLLIITAVLAVGGFTSLITPTSSPAQFAAGGKKPLRALLVCGGCCHDYEKQGVILQKGIEARANVRVDVIHSSDRSTKAYFEIYESPDWAKEYDVVIHDECSADIKDEKYVQNILGAHKSVPAVNLHCAMHSYRVGNDSWFKYIGLKSSGHGPQVPIEIKHLESKHPVLETLSAWTTGNEELYNNLDIYETATPLSSGKQVINGKEVEAVVTWTNNYEGVKIFNTTLGHNNTTVEDARYLDLITRGLLWSANQLNADYLKPYQGEPGKVINVANKPAPPPAPPETPKDATLVKVTSSSEEKDKGNLNWKALDGSDEGRWCASSGSFPQWIQLEFDKPETINALGIKWEKGNAAYQFQVEGSADGQQWKVLKDEKNNQKAGDSALEFQAQNVRFLKITITGSQDGWASIREIKAKGPNIKQLAPKVDAAVQKALQDEAQYAERGNVPPRIVKLTPEQEAEILKDAKVSDEFEIRLFAPSETANYPVYVGAATDGTLFVSSDGNGSLGRKPERGRILRLQDRDGDGRADHVNIFADKVDSPRGLVWDHDRLYVVHPPHLSVFIDHDGDGVSDEQKILVKNIAFGFKDRPADHTTNGLSIGVDGWLYIAGGDFGFMEAEGVDGRKLQHRGGGVIRVRPDGTGLELYSTGTRNVLEIAVGPLMNMFARDNTNDGGGWDVRFHHFTPLAHHGYPTLYKNFNDEAIQPLADYGGGSGCGAAWLDEPGYAAKWRNVPLTADWGTAGIYKHEVKAKGSTFEEVSKPEKIIQMTRPTDADVDGLSNLYAASWKGANFDWAGPNVGYIVQVRPKGYQAPPLPDYDKLDAGALIKELSSESYRRRLEAQRTLLRKNMLADQKVAVAVANLAMNTSAKLEARVAAIYTMKLAMGAKSHGALARLAQDPSVVRWVLQALADHPTQTENLPVPAIEVALKSQDAAVQIQAAFAVEHLKLTQLAKPLTALLSSSDLVVQHTAIRALGSLKAEKELFEVVDQASVSDLTRRNALRALALIHEPVVVEGLIKRLESANSDDRRQAFFLPLARLANREGRWKGDSWGTRPDTTGPYYQPEPWEETSRILAALNASIQKASPDLAGVLVGEMTKNRIRSDEALNQVLELAEKNAGARPEAVNQLYALGTVPPRAVPIVITVAQDDKMDPEVLVRAITLLGKVDGNEAVNAALTGFANLQQKGLTKELQSLFKAYYEAPKLENHHQLLDQIASKVGDPKALWAEAGLLKLSIRNTGSPESREMAAKDLEKGWQNVARRAQIIEAVREINHHPFAEKVLAALKDEDQKVRDEAAKAAKQMKLATTDMPSGPKVAELKPEEVIQLVVKAKGDIALGEQLFTRQTCVACHTVTTNEPQRGPYLGNIAATYPRAELAVAILDPAKSIAQGFATNLIVLKNGEQHVGFVTFESAEKVTIRNIASQEFSFSTADISKRDKLPVSMMPPGLANALTIHEFASLLDYLEDLTAKQKP